MKGVIEGIRKFQATEFPQRKELFHELATGQHPTVLLVTCADSRISPSLITQTQPGHVFMCRNAGNVVPPHGQYSEGTVASIEYAVAVLGVADIIVCGHTHCGAVGAAMDMSSLDELPHVHSWLQHCLAAVEVVKHRHGKLEKDHLMELTQENVLVQMQNLRTHPVVAARQRDGRLNLHGWIYDIEQGDFIAYDPQEDAWVPVLDYADRYVTA